MLSELNSRNQKYKQKIAADVVLKYLSKHCIPALDVEIACDLGLPVSLVRNELNNLINQDLVVVRNHACTGKTDSPGLEYQLLAYKKIQCFVKNCPKEFTIQDIIKELEIEKKTIRKALKKMVEFKIIKSTKEEKKEVFVCADL